MTPTKFMTTCSKSFNVPAVAEGSALEDEELDDQDDEEELQADEDEDEDEDADEDEDQVLLDELVVGGVQVEVGVVEVEVEVGVQVVVGSGVHVEEGGVYWLEDDVTTGVEDVVGPLLPSLNHQVPVRTPTD